jgi:hypothetical protein
MRTQAENATYTTQAVLAARHAQGTGYQGLADPAFFTLWSAVRDWLAYTPAGKPGHAAFKHLNDAVSAEFRQRLDGSPARAS